MIVLELCLSQPSARDDAFSALLETLGYNTVTGKIRNWKRVSCLSDKGDIECGGTKLQNRIIKNSDLSPLNC